MIFIGCYWRCIKIRAKTYDITSETKRCVMNKPENIQTNM